MRLYVSPNVLYEEIQGCLVILDLSTEAYYILDAVGTSMWKSLLATNDETQALRTLQSEYLVERVRLKADLETFRELCIEQGFLQKEEAERKAGISVYAGRQDFLVPRAWWCLCCTVRSLSANGLARTYQKCCGLAVPKENPVDADDLLERAVAAFAMAENLFLIKSAPKDCLPRSLALFRFLRSAGLPVEHCIGVQRFPFQAHAWVEYGGRVVQDHPSRQSVFRTIARISA